ncbi:MAG: SDR family NAD(P)-dependent oxidoreductase [Chloroflexi bacterium]|nr:SDR family NAD(P)-dependent oxidoreductase [Chloroflexota bacterium]
MRLEGRTVIVTGASGGIGREIVEAFAREGCNVVLASRNKERLDVLAEELADLPGRRLVVLTDVTDPAQVQALARRTQREFRSIDILVNNAGIGVFAPIADGSIENMRRLFEVNLWGALNCIQAVVPQMRKQERGQIINISSVAGKIATPFIGAYSASKFALTAISDALRLELARDGIKVIAVYPGVTASDFRENAIREVELPEVPLVRAVPARVVGERVVQAARWEPPEVFVSVEDVMAVALKNVAPRLVDWGFQRFWLGAQNQ